MLGEIAARDSEEVGVFILQLLEVRVFMGVNDLILDLLVHHSRIIIYSPAFVILGLQLVPVVCIGVCWNHGVYSWVRCFGTSRGREGGLEHQNQADANATLLYSSLWGWKGCHVGI